MKCEKVDAVLSPSLSFALVMQVVKNPPANEEDVFDLFDQILCLIPGLGRSPGEEHSNMLKYSCLDSPTDRAAWWAMVHGVEENCIGLRTDIL